MPGVNGISLASLVGAAVVPFHHPPDVAHHRLRRHGAEGGDLRHRLGAVLVLHVLDHAVAAVLAEVDVEVGHGYPLRVEEALEQEVVAQRVEIGDAERIGDQRARARAAPRPHRHRVRLGPVDEVGDDEKVAGEAHLGNHLDLEFQARAVLGLAPGTLVLAGEEFCQAQCEALAGLLREIILQAHPGRRGKRRQLALAQFQRQVAAARDLDAVGERLGNVGEQFRHFRLRLEVALLGEDARPALVGEHVALGDAHPRFMGEKIPGLQELHRVGRNHRQRQPAGERERALNIGLGGCATRALQLDIGAPREQLRPFTGQALGLRNIVLHQRAADIAALRA